MKPKYNKLLVGFRIVRPNGYVVSEFWIDSQTHAVHVTSFFPGGLVERSGKVSLEELLDYVTKLKEESDARRS